LIYKKNKDFSVPSRFLPAYLAGRIDGDGSIDRKYRSGIRIAYSDKKDAKHDVLLFGRQNVSLYFYKSAGTWVIYLRKDFREKIINKITKYSIKLCPVETSLK
jgi:intein/homing endonuclease